jgi:lipopolysaccharide transport system ATP-binding protein
MNRDIVVRVESLGKKYLISHKIEHAPYTTLRDTTASLVAGAWRKAAGLARGRAMAGGDAVQEFWALRNVSFEVKRGDIMGIVGRNGSGKSTLLKILSRVTDPSEGRVTIDGRIASLLEVGTGFHPELTGRENVYLNGIILGMLRAEIKRKFDEIVAFSGVEKFLDTPIKRYSSGMYVRLAFAIAAHLEPDILVIDEVLSLGDAEFQKKCLGKIDEVANSGRTVLFVSHDMRTVASLCSRGLVLNAGILLADSDMKAAIAAYTSHLTAGNGDASNIVYQRAARLDPAQTSVTRVEMLNSIGRPITSTESNYEVIFRIRFHVHAAVPMGSVILTLRTVTGATLAKFETNPARVQPLAQPGNHYIDCRIDSLPLIAGQYFVGAGLARHGVRMIDWGLGDGAFTVTVSNDPELEMSASPDGPLCARHSWDAESPDAEASATANWAID